MSIFVWFGILGLVLVYAAVIMMVVAKRKKVALLRRYHSITGQAAAVSLAIHAVWANVQHRGELLPSFGWVGLVGVAGIFFAYYAILRAKNRGEQRWRQLHWQIGLGGLLVATAHAAWFLWRILQLR